ncbi:MAG: Glutamyl-tRNA(Gln) amidotransferase subunit A [Candidatus Omnitrophica bacterium ADurb.Bin292]|jgi:aspartyl-tRNA(Asn)/glutamyl-tRNA(Gln) amidotransferase subunit A|nr:MAG: Glutamyl-tRNA(Gln) amidotransferase subunit A [Candidatus Omnitrophica bacterium ADurb.Bin292]HOG23971.1 Asp-tRNA(Asn)/Glu-tRNA(Gln) amidotransferase subunit GatA [Candidatus Omnitrophota bacterium]HPW77392.1 Asp-tRNA(Asn)/Glu-tRNA(Gln) amidotransferase subunit GatA [Candidatus Omnitrophota bacterium]HQB12020.1 Asp-tRNA(Asn)/Glu-tRNA(Gln) amidotransferase subunit GatA [Candidatus Omnitrophota bacterium]
MDLTKLTLKEAVEFSKENGVQPILDAFQKRAGLLNSRINAFLRCDSLLEKMSIPGTSALLAGVPISIKDNICIEGREVTCASKIMTKHVPPYDATVIEKLKSAGATIFHQCNMDEFALGSSCETSAFGACRNPWDFNCVPGGSSGGSAAAVAADMTVAAIGSDSGGSIRQPAALCGVVGVKPTYGRVSRYGLIAFGSSFDQIGPITKTVEDAAILMNVISGHDPKDSTSAPDDVPDFTQSLKRQVKGLRIGLPTEYFIEGIDPEVEKAVRQAGEIYKRLGAEIKIISLPHTEYSVAVYYIVAVAEASSNLGRFDGVEYGLRVPSKDLREMYFETRNQGFGQEAKRRILLGTFVLSAGYYDAFYLKGQKVRTLIRQDFEKAFKEVDVILSPTSPTPAFKIGERTEDPIAMYLSDIFTIPANLAGIPAMSVPCGFTAGGLPIGLQLMARPFDEATLFRAAYTFEQETGVYKKKPKLD